MRVACAGLAAACLNSKISVALPLAEMAITWMLCLVMMGFNLGGLGKAADALASWMRFIEIERLGNAQGLSPYVLCWLAK